MLTSPAALSTLKETGFFVSTSKVLLSSSAEEILRTSNGLLVGKPPLAVKKMTAPMPRHTNAMAITRRLITIGRFIFVFLVYKVPHACYHAYGRMFPLRLTGGGRKSFKMGSRQVH